MFLSIEPHPEGLPPKEFNKHLDAFLTHGNLNPEILEFMNERQQFVVNEIKKALARLDNKNGKENIL